MNALVYVSMSFECISELRYEVYTTGIMSNSTPSPCKISYVLCLRPIISMDIVVIGSRSVGSKIIVPVQIHQTERDH